MFSGCARSSPDDPASWAVVADIGEIRSDAAASVLARAAAQGHRLAQRELYHRLASNVHAALHAVLGSNDHMELHLQNAFVEIFRRLTSYDREIDLDTWACAIAVRNTGRQAHDSMRDGRAGRSCPLETHDGRIDGTAIAIAFSDQ